MNAIILSAVITVMPAALRSVVVEAPSHDPSIPDKFRVEVGSAKFV